MKRTKYFTTDVTDTIKIWRYKDGEMRYFDDSTLCWHPSLCVCDGTNNGQGWHQITRDEARKLEPEAFR
jgi:hypothetical protein